MQTLSGKVQLYYGSLTDAHAVQYAVRDFQPEAVAHLGAVTPVAYSFEHPHEVNQTNYIGTINIAEACLREVRHLRKFILASSMETFGANPKRTPYTEEDEQKAGAPYAVSKIAAEKYIHMLNFAYGFPSIAFRQTNAYCRKHNDYFVTEAIVTQMLKGSVCNLGDPRPVRNLIHIDDLIDLYVAALKSDDSVHGHSFNSGPNYGVTIEELADRIAKKLNWKGQINWYTRPRRPGEVFYLVSECDKAKRMLGWEPKISLDEGLDRTIAIWKKNLGITEEGPACAQ
jgi:dTDP-glucose 4,6-dehydratase